MLYKKFFLFALIFTKISLSQLTNSDWNAEEYAENSEPQWVTSMNELKKFEILQTDDVLDIGCGDGKITVYIATKLAKLSQVVGIDKSTNMIMLAKKIHKDIKNLEFRNLGATEITYDQEFEKVISFWTFHWIEDSSAALKKLYKSLKPGGKALICCMVDRPTKVFEYIIEMLQQEKWKKYAGDKKIYLYIIDHETFIKQIKEENFKLLYLEVKNSVDFYPTKEKFEESYKTIPFVDFIPQDLRSEFFKQVFNKFYRENEELIGPEDNIFDPSPSITVIIQK